LYRYYIKYKVELQANSKKERSLPCEPLHRWQITGLRQAVLQIWQASVSMQVSRAMHRIGVNSKGCAVAYFEESSALRYQKKGWQ
jgi:hypothetical protein